MSSTPETGCSCCDAAEAFRAVLVASTPDPVVTCDPDGRILELNLAAERAFGYAPSEAAGRRLSDLVADAEGRTTATRADGTTFPAEVVAVRADLPTRSLLVAHVRDLSPSVNVVEAERQLDRSQRLETIGWLVASVAHDFNNLLGVVQGYAELLLEGDGATVDRADALELKRAARSAATLAREMLDFCRRQRLEPQSLDLNAVIGELRALVGKLLGERVELETHLAPDLGRVFADQASLERVLVNLAVNARQATKGGRGRLTVSTANVDLPDGAFVSLVVADDGVGMDEETKSRLFEPFFSTKGAGGHGLGLAAVQAAVGASGGRIMVASEPGAGARFTILLPREEST